MGPRYSEGNTPTTYLWRLRPVLDLLLPPHLEQLRQIPVPWALHFERIQCLAQKVLNAAVLRLAQEILDRVHELGVQVARKRMPGIIHEDAHEHDRIVLQRSSRRGRVRQELADARSGLLGRGGTGRGIFNDRREVYVFVALLQYRCIESVGPHRQDANAWGEIA